MKITVKADKSTIGMRVRFGKHSRVEGKRVVIEDGVSIGEGTVITADDIFIGYGSKIDERCTIALAGPGSKFSMGDNCLIGSDSKILVPVFETGDYVTLHNHALVNGFKPVRIGHNSWIGQNCILNANEKITIGNNVGGGIYSSIWTHGFYGELLEGCNVYKVAPVVIEDDVWILGAYNVIFPGTRLGRKSIIMTGSVVTKNVAANSCVSGNPAVDISDKISPYRKITVDEKFVMMKKFTDEFIDQRHKNNSKRMTNGWKITINDAEWAMIFMPEANDNLLMRDEKIIVIAKKNLAKTKFKNTVIFDISTKRYTKRRHPLEIEFMRFLVSHRARFIPVH
jgi:acetyltransferase-like isoleucine patch superfamily enzyme